MLKNKTALLILGLIFFCVSLFTDTAFGEDLEAAIKELQESVIRKKRKESKDASGEVPIVVEKEKEEAEEVIESEIIIEKEIKAEEDEIEQIEIFEYEESSAQELLRQHYNLALAYDQNQQFDEAEAEYKKALKADPNDPDTHYNLGIIYDDYFQDKVRAIAHYEKYLEFRPGARDGGNVRSWIRWAKQQLALNKFK